MNLYKLHAKPKELQHQRPAHGLVPKLVWADRSKRTEKYAYEYARDVLKNPLN